MLVGIYLSKRVKRKVEINVDLLYSNIRDESIANKMPTQYFDTNEDINYNYQLDNLYCSNEG